MYFKNSLWFRIVRGSTWLYSLDSIVRLIFPHCVIEIGRWHLQLKLAYPFPGKTKWGSVWVHLEWPQRGEWIPRDGFDLLVVVRRLNRLWNVPCIRRRRAHIEANDPFLHKTTILKFHGRHGGVVSIFVSSQYSAFQVNQSLCLLQIIAIVIPVWVNKLNSDFWQYSYWDIPQRTRSPVPSRWWSSWLGGTPTPLFFHHRRWNAFFSTERPTQVLLLRVVQ